MKLSEPVTAITDHILGIELIVLSILLFMKSEYQISMRFWGGAFVALAFAAFAGGVFHGNRQWFTPAGLLQMETLIKFCVLISVVLMVVAGLVSSFSGLARWILLLTIPILIIYGAIHFLKQGGNLPTHTPVRTFVILFVLFGGLLIYQIVRHGPLVGNWILVATLICLVAAAIQSSKISLHPNFNYNDICHVILMIAMFFLYRGGMLLRDR